MMMRRNPAITVNPELVNLLKVVVSELHENVPMLTR